MNVFNSIKFRLAWSISFLIVAIVVILSVMSYKHEKKAIQNRLYAQLNSTADLKKELVVDYINERMNDLRTIAAAGHFSKNIFYLLDAKRDMHNTEQYKYVANRLNSFKDIYRDYVDIEALDIRGNIIASTDNSHANSNHSLKHEHREGINRYMESIKRGGAVVMQDYLYSETKHIDFAIGVKDERGDVRAVIVSSIALQGAIFPIFSDYTGLGHTGETLILKLKNGSVQFINPTRYPLDSMTKPPQNGIDYMNIAERAASGNEGMDEAVDYRGRHVIGAYRYIPVLGWGIIAKIDIDEAFQEINELSRNILVLGIILLGIMLTASNRIMNCFISPVMSLRQKTKAVASGDYSIKIESKRKDEIGELERDFNEMVSVLYHSRKEIAQKQLELEQSNFMLDRKVQERTKELSDSNIALMNALEDVRKFSYAVEQSPVSIVITDTQGNIEYANEQYCRISGYLREELIGKHSGILKSGETPPEEYKRLWLTITSGRTWTGVFHNKKKSGELFWESAIISPIKDDKENITHFIGIKENITERKKLEEMLMHAQKMEAIGQLAGGIAHDFNNILTAIIGFGGLIQMNIKEDDPNNPYLKELLHAAERATHLTHGLLAFSRKQVIDPKPVNINEIIRGMQKLLKRVLREDIELKTILADMDLNAMADEGQIEQVLMNLATNARDAMPEHGILTISTEQVTIDEDFIKTHGYGRRGEYVLTSVSDTGAGMDEKTRERIFEPFFTTKEVGKGTGLGLSIAYGIIKQHEGYINCYSEPGMGTTFKIYLPEISVEGREEKPSSEAVITGGTETILLAEDDASTRKLTKEVLVKFGYNVIEAVDGDEAVRKFAQNKDNIHMLLLDVIMPKKNGREAFKEMDSIKPGVKTIFMSGYTADIIHEKGIFEEGINFITKPASPKELLKKVREVLDEQKG